MALGLVRPSGPTARCAVGSSDPSELMESPAIRGAYDVLTALRPTRDAPQERRDDSGRGEMLIIGPQEDKDD